MFYHYAYWYQAVSHACFFQNKRNCIMSPAQLKELQELSHIFSQGKASPKQIQQLSALLAQINCYGEEGKAVANEQANFIRAPNFG